MRDSMPSVIFDPRSYRQSISAKQFLMKGYTVSFNTIFFAHNGMHKGQPDRSDCPSNFYQIYSLCGFIFGLFPLINNFSDIITLVDRYGLRFHGVGNFAHQINHQ